MEFVWSLNVAGLQGLWRLSHFVQSQPEGSRPAIICVQEAACNQRQLDGLESLYRQTGVAEPYWLVTLMSRGRTLGSVWWRFSTISIPYQYMMNSLQDGPAVKLLTMVWQTSIWLLPAGFILRSFRSQNGRVSD